jgi:hypothetical protein
VRELENGDQINLKVLGGVGGEGGANLTPPAGVVYRVKAGRSLVIQAHFQNATQEVEMGRSRIDVKFEPASPERTVGSLFGVATLGINVVPGSSSIELGCQVRKELRILSVVNHMHQWGVAAKTTIEVDGQTTVLKDDPVWNYEWATNPNGRGFPLEKPFIFQAGAHITRCEWMNPSAKTRASPRRCASSPRSTWAIATSAASTGSGSSGSQGSGGAFRPMTSSAAPANGTTMIAASAPELRRMGGGGAGSSVNSGAGSSRACTGAAAGGGDSAAGAGVSTRGLLPHGL